MGGQRTALRLLLFGIIAAGVLGMHTLGHPGAGGHCGAATHPGTAATQGEHVLVAVTDSASDVSVVGVRCGLDPWNVCLAILVTFGLAALIAYLMTTARRPGPPGPRRQRMRFVAGRGPPSPSRLGLRLADLSVLRA